MNRFLKLGNLLVELSLLFISSCCLGTTGLCHSTESDRPNIVFILTDDQGYGDVSIHGNPILRTPHLDRLHSQSVRFTDFHVSPTCSPTRSALLTGRHEFFNGVTHTILERERLSLDAITLAELVAEAGYSTGIFGKWHLGDEDEYLPNKRGFEEVFIHGGGGIGQSYPGSCGDAPGNTYFNPVIWHNDRFEKTLGFCTDLFFDQALDWMNKQRQAEQPFFAYIATNAPHSPYTARPEDAAVYEESVSDHGTRNFFGMIHNIDENIGRLIAKLEDWSIANNTLLIFMNDNGTAAGQKVFNAEMRGAKGTVWLGGTRASSFWRWPGTLEPGDRSHFTAHIDFLPTIAEIIGVDLTGELALQVQGRSLVPLLKDASSEWEDRMLVSHLGRWPKFSDPASCKYRMAAVRNSKWSLVSAEGSENPDWQLFDLENDRGQRNNVLEKHPEVVRLLESSFEQWWLDIQPHLVNEQAIGPEVNPYAQRYIQQFDQLPVSGN